MSSGFNLIPPKRFIINDRQLCDLEMILNGGFSPLEGFMCKKDYNNVLDKSRLSDGTVWPLPIVLAIPENLFRKDEDVVLQADYNTTIELVHESDLTHIIAEIEYKDIYRPDLKNECIKSLGSCDDNHPYINYILSNPDVLYVGGKVTEVGGVNHFDFYKNRLTPKDIKQKIKENEWNQILGFQTRNPMHNCHYALTKYALSQMKGQGRKALILQPVVGVTQPGDVDYHVRVRCYRHLLSKYKDEGIDTTLCLLPLSMRMAGPREALLHAIVRSNYGCTHFVVGRDHAGPSTKTKDGKSFYQSYDAHEYVSQFKNEVNIEIITSKMLVYSSTRDEYVPMTSLEKDEEYQHLSGTELRSRLSNRENIPKWFTMPQIAKELQSVYSSNKAGLCVYFIGLSGAGKTTISKALHQRLQEKYDKDMITILDGDVIREHLGQGLGFSKKDRSINVRRIGYVASLVVRAGGIVLCANIAPYNEDRIYNRQLIEGMGGKYIEVHVDTPIDVCEDRDVKGLYKKARAGQIKQFTGISDPFERPTNSDLRVQGVGNMNAILDDIEYLL
jgi:sulfate adenylyltransferase